MWASTKWVFMYVWFSLYVPLARLTSPEALPEKTIFFHITCGIALYLQENVQAAFFINLAGQMNFKKLTLFLFSAKTKVLYWRLKKLYFLLVAFWAMYLCAQTSCASGRIIYRECLPVEECPYFFSDNIQGPLCPHWAWFICVQSLEQYNSITCFFFANVF